MPVIIAAVIVPVLRVGLAGESIPFFPFKGLVYKSIKVPVPFRTLACSTVQFTMYRAKSDLPEKCIFRNISDQAKDNEMKTVGGWEFELVQRELAKIANALRPLHCL